MVASKTSTICVVDGYWTHAFHLQLSAMPGKQQHRLTNDSAACGPQCIRTKALQEASRNLTDAMRQSITKLIDRIYLLTGKPRPISMSRRSRRTNWLGYAINWVSEKTN